VGWTPTLSRGLQTCNRKRAADDSSLLPFGVVTVSGGHPEDQEKRHLIRKKADPRILSEEQSQGKHWPSRTKSRKTRVFFQKETLPRIAYPRALPEEHEAYFHFTSTSRR